MEFGSFVLVDARLERLRASIPNSRSWRRYWSSINDFEQKKCLFIGWRWLTNGKVWPDYEEGHTYVEEERFKAALVVENERTKPFYVMPHNVTPIATNTEGE